MAAKSGLFGVSYEFPCDCLYMHRIRRFLHPVQSQLGYCRELEMFFQGRSGHH